VEHERFRPVAEPGVTLQQRYGIEQGAGPIVLYVGNEFPRKNLGALVHAIGVLRRGSTPVRWVKVGTAGLDACRESLRRDIAAESIEDAVTFVEGVPDSDLPLFYSAAAVYVQPSLVEGFGLPVLEAMACGTPVVASRAGALPEVCGDAALLIDPRSPADLAAAIGSILDDESRRESMIARGFEQAGRFSWRETAERTARVYAGLRDQTTERAVPSTARSA
jgi:glycosyltransferase involved in cell wall biosynthesis